MAVALLVLMGAGACKKKQAAWDLSTPRGAAVTFARALERGDAQAARAAALAGGIENDLLDVMAVSIPALSKLDAASRSKFGEAGRELVRNTAVNAVTLLSEGELSMNDTSTRATITTRDGENTLQIKLIDGQWKVDVGAMIRGQDVTQTIPMLRAIAAAAKEVTSEIQAGKIESADKARREMATRTFTAMHKTGAAAPGSQPASVLIDPPATTPALQQSE